MKKHHDRGFTLVELLVSITILLIMMMMINTVISKTSSVWKQTQQKLEKFRESRMAFEVFTRRISQATLNTSWGYDREEGPTKYLRHSELRFASGPITSSSNTGNSLLDATLAASRSGHGIFFNAIFGEVEDPSLVMMKELLNTWGYFVEYGSDAGYKPVILGTRVADRNRFRLMEFRLPSERVTVYKYTSGINRLTTIPHSLSYQGMEWIKDGFNSDPLPVTPMAENIIALIILPKLAQSDDPLGTQLAPEYTYRSDTDSNINPKLNSRNQLPPILEVTMVAVDEVSAARIDSIPGAVDFLRDNSRFQNAARYKADLYADADLENNSLEAFLINNNLNYKVFSTQIYMRGAKWGSN